MSHLCPSNIRSRFLMYHKASGRQNLSSLTRKLPQLRDEFYRHADDNQVFPLFPPKVEAKVWKTVPIDDSRTAAVFVPIVNFQGRASLLFTRRSSDLPTHANEISFPGGHFDSVVDQTVRDTALRETQEELLEKGTFPWHEVEFIGETSTLPSIKGTPVTAVIGVLPGEISDDTFAGNPGEVDEVFCVSVNELLSIETESYSDRFRAKIPEYPVAENKRIWGLTAVITKPILHKLLRPVFHDINDSTHFKQEHMKKSKL